MWFLFSQTWLHDLFSYVLFSTCFICFRLWFCVFLYFRYLFSDVIFPTRLVSFNMWCFSYLIHLFSHDVPPHRPLVMFFQNMIYLIFTCDVFHNWFISTCFRVTFPIWLIHFRMWFYSIVQYFHMWLIYYKAFFFQLIYFLFIALFSKYFIHFRGTFFPLNSFIFTFDFPHCYFLHVFIFYYNLYIYFHIIF